VADLTHLGGAVVGRPGEPAHIAARHKAEAGILVSALRRGDVGAAQRHLNELRHDPGGVVDP
jgi:hypothetical protein